MALSEGRESSHTEFQSSRHFQASQAPLRDGQSPPLTARHGLRRKPKRTTNACITCRQSKVRCSGSRPCEYCQRRSLECIFADDGRRVTISERYLRYLQNQAKRLSRFEVGSSSKQSHGNNFEHPDDQSDMQPLQAPIPIEEEQQEGRGSLVSPHAPSVDDYTSHHEENALTSPFTLPSMTMRNQQNTPRGWIWLGPSSMASFTARLTLMISQQLNPHRPDDVPVQLDGDVYKLESKLSIDINPADLKGIPSLDYSLYAFSTVKFHLCQLFRILDENEFFTHMQEFYRDAASKIATSRLWFMQFLLVLAFAKAFLSQTQSSKTLDPPGAAFFIQAMALMPNYTRFWEDPLLAIEVLALMALYLYSVDRKESAFLYVGHAVRISLMEGLHTELPREKIGSKAWKRCYDLWWTVYVLDRHFSATQGVPISIQDSDITTPLLDAKEAPQTDAIMTLQVKLSHFLSGLLDSLFKFEKGYGKPFLDQTKSNLSTLASLSQDLEEVVDTKFKDSIDSPSKATLHITLLHHRCVILTMRPLFLSVLTERLRRLESPEVGHRKTSTLVNTLVSTGVESATKSLKLLTTLVENNSIDTFLPFDLEFTMGAGILLTLAKSLFPNLIEESCPFGATHLILDEMISKGNRVAEARKAELQRLESTCQELSTREASGCSESGQSRNSMRMSSSSVPHPTNRENAILSFNAPLPENVPCTLEDLPQVGVANKQNFSNEGFFSNFGVSSDNLLSVADQICYNYDTAQGDLLDEWIWDTSLSGDVG